MLMPTECRRLEDNTTDNEKSEGEAKPLQKGYHEPSLKPKVNKNTHSYPKYKVLLTLGTLRNREV
jgi:hypothetical protein